MQCRFKRLVTVLMVTAVFLAVLPLTVLATSGQADTSTQPATAETLGPNLLTNPGMDGKYVKQCSVRDGGQPWVQVPCPANYNAESGRHQAVGNHADSVRLVGLVAAAQQ